MKKSIWAVLGLLISTLIWAANSDIKMVTYFPTRYMIYQDVTVKGPMEVGIGQAAKLDVAKDVTMTHGRVADSTTLTLTGADINSSSKYGQRITSGSGSTDTRGTLQFDGGVTVPATGLSSGVQSIETDHKATLTGLTLGTKAFPACNDGNGGHNISWQKLTIDNKDGVFLVCGNGSAAEQTCTENPNQEECCTDAGYAWYPRGPSSRSGGTTNCCTTTTTTSTVAEEYYVSPSYEAESEWIWSQMRPINMNSNYAFTGTILKGSCNDYLDGFSNDEDVTWGYNACTAVPDLAGGSACDTYAYTNCSTVGYDAPVCERKELVSFRCVCK